MKLNKLITIEKCRVYTQDLDFLCELQSDGSDPEILTLIKNEEGEVLLSIPNDTLEILIEALQITIIDA